MTALASRTQGTLLQATFQLSPCPFCNCGAPVPVVAVSRPRTYRVACPNCGALGPEMRTQDEPEKMWSNL